MSTQFPPSSPVHEDIVPKRARTEVEYPTPNPSSETGEAPLSLKSTPVKLTRKLVPSELIRAAAKDSGKMVTIDTSADQRIEVGRSSKLAHVSVNPHNKLVSRVHCVLNYSKKNSKLMIECQGWNGINCTVPASVEVKHVGNKHYVVKPTGAIRKGERVLYVDPQFTNFYVLKGETVELPAMDGTVLDLRGELLVLEFAEGRGVASQAHELEQLEKTISGTSRESTPLEHKRVRKAYIREEEKEEKELVIHMSEEEVADELRGVTGIENLSNVLANHIAYSRLLQVPFSQLLTLNPVKQKKLTRLQLRCILCHRIPCIGVIYREGSDAAGLPLDEEYYYIPERDDDQSRVKLVEDLKGSGSHLRSCRKTHKQYFWKRPKK